MRTYSRGDACEIGGLEADLDPVCIHVSSDNLCFRRRGRDEVAIHYRNKLRLWGYYGRVATQHIAQACTCKASTKQVYLVYVHLGTRVESNADRGCNSLWTAIGNRFRDSIGSVGSDACSRIA